MPRPAQVLFDTLEATDELATDPVDELGAELGADEATDELLPPP